MTHGSLQSRGQAPSPGFLSRFALLLAVALACAGCATNPATGRSQLNFYSEAQEIAMGRQADGEISRELGVVDDAQLQSYVEGVGHRLAAQSERPNLPWSFKVMDDAAVNAFALPGGFVFVTRGILAHLGSEAELAAVLGHEIGHVTAQHGVNQLSKQQLAEGGLLAGMVVAPEVAQAVDLAKMGLGALFLKYGRDDERQADDLGLRYMAAAHHEVREMPRVFALLGKVSSASGAGRVPNWLSSHPEPGVREARSKALIAERAYPAGEVGVESYLDRLDGLPFGRDPRQGFFDNGSFLHPDFGFEMRFPSGWKAVNETSRVVALHPEGVAMVQLRVTEAATATEAARAFVGQDGIAAQVQGVRRWNGLPAAAADFAIARQQGGRLVGRALFIETQSAVFAIYGLAVEGRWTNVRGAIEEALSSFEVLTNPEILAARVRKLEIVRLPAAMTFDQASQRFPSTVSKSTSMLINAIEDAAQVLDAGTLFKQIVGRSFGDQQ